MYMHLSDVRSFADLLYYINTHAFMIPVIACAVAFTMVYTSRKAYTKGY